MIPFRDTEVLLELERTVTMQQEQKYSLERELDEKRRLLRDCMAATGDTVDVNLPPSIEHLKRSIAHLQLESRSGSSRVYELEEEIRRLTVTISEQDGIIAQLRSEISLISTELSSQHESMRIKIETRLREVMRENDFLREQNS